MEAILLNNLGEYCLLFYSEHWLFVTIYGSDNIDSKVETFRIFVSL